MSGTLSFVGNSGFSEVLVCAAGVTLVRRVDNATGAVSFTGTNGAAVAAPAAYSIGACQTDLEAVDFCLRANTAGADYAVGDQIKLTRWFNPSTNTQVSEVAFNMTQGGSVVAVPLTAANFDECPAGGGAVETLVCANGTSLIRRVDNITGAVTFIGANGAPVAAPASYSVGACPPAITLTAFVANVAAGVTQTIAALVPAGKVLVGLSVLVLAGTATVTNFDNTTVTLLPSSIALNFNADNNGTLIPPTSVTAAAGTGRVVLEVMYR